MILIKETLVGASYVGGVENKRIDWERFVRSLFDTGELDWNTPFEVMAKVMCAKS